jgi:tetratricopeptide (TPR) repeat protein
LGIILLQLGGNDIHKEITYSEIQTQILKNQFSKPKNISEELFHLIFGLLNPHQEMRIKSKEFLAHSFVSNFELLKSEDLEDVFQFYSSLNFSPKSVLQVANLFVLSWICFKRSQYQKADQILSNALKIQRKRCGENHLCTAGLYFLQCELEFYKGNYKRSSYYCRKAKDIREKLLEENHPKLIECYLKYGWIAKSLCEYSEAAKSFDQALRVSKKRLGNKTFLLLLLLIQKV